MPWKYFKLGKGIEKQSCWFNFQPQENLEHTQKGAHEDQEVQRSAGRYAVYGTQIFLK